MSVRCSKCGELEHQFLISGICLPCIRKMPAEIEQLSGQLLFVAGFMERIASRIGISTEIGIDLLKVSKEVLQKVRVV